MLSIVEFMAKLRIFPENVNAELLTDNTFYVNQIYEKFTISDNNMCVQYDL